MTDLTVISRMSHVMLLRHQTKKNFSNFYAVHQSGDIFRHTPAMKVPIYERN